ncbi:MAG: CDGSH iron-sulfur domain-containing protein [Deinococcales bacterium]
MKLTARENGSVLVETSGKFILKSSEGEQVIEKERFSLCRCGHSQNKPFCDGAHKAAGFTAPACEIEL